MVFFSTFRRRAANATVFLSHEKFFKERRFLVVVMGSILGAGMTANQVATHHQFAAVNTHLVAMEEAMKMGFKTTNTTIKALETKLNNALQALETKLNNALQALETKLDKVLQHEQLKKN